MPYTSALYAGFFFGIYDLRKSNESYIDNMILLNILVYSLERDLKWERKIKRDDRYTYKSIQRERERERVLM